MKTTTIPAEGCGPTHELGALRAANKAYVESAFRLYDADTDDRLEGELSSALIDESLRERSGTGIVTAFFAGRWEHVPESRVSDYERFGYDVRRVYAA